MAELSEQLFQEKKEETIFFRNGDCIYKLKESDYVEGGPNHNYEAIIKVNIPNENFNSDLEHFEAKQQAASEILELLQLGHQVKRFVETQTNLSSRKLAKK